jgi:hypothetical protein
MLMTVNALILRATLIALLTTIPARAVSQSGPDDDPEAHPPVTNADLRIVRRARQILNDSSKWNRADTRNCPADANAFSLYCALEKATKEVTGSFQHRGAAMQEARFVIDEIAPNRKKYEHRLMDYNNDPSTTFADIQKVFELMERHMIQGLKKSPQGAKP